MSDLHSIIKEYLEFTAESGEPIDRSVLQYPELLPMCRELKITYDEAIEAMFGRQLKTTFFTDLMGIITDEQMRSDESFQKTMGILSAINSVENFPFQSSSH